MHTSRRWTFFAVLAFVFAACSTACGGATADATAPATTPGPFDADLLEVGRTFQQWPRVSDRANFAPWDCRIPPPAGVQRSASDDDRTHGEKLYFLFASRPRDYELLTGDSPVGQTVVKQSFAAEPVAAADVPRLPTTGPFDRTVPAEFRCEGEQWYRIGAPRELFVMRKYEPATPGTDQGWVYGVLSADGSKVLAAGVLASCRKCHVEDTHDRLFGMYRDRRRR